MADFYKVLKADPLGVPWTPNKPGAKAIQNYWCEVEGQEKAVSIGRQVDNPLRPGVYVYGDLVYTKSQKGTKYWKFKSQQVPEGVARPTDDPATPAQATAQQATGSQPVGTDVPAWAVPLYNMVEFIYKEMKAMSVGEDDLPASKEPSTNGVEVLAGDVDEVTQQTLTEIFGEPETPEDK